MSERISNTNQKVDREKYGENFDKIVWPTREHIESVKKRQREELPHLWEDESETTSD